MSMSLSEETKHAAIQSIASEIAAIEADMKTPGCNKKTYNKRMADVLVKLMKTQAAHASR